MLTHEFQIYSDLLNLGVTFTIEKDEDTRLVFWLQRESGKSKNILETTLPEYRQSELLTRFCIAVVKEVGDQEDPTRAYQDILHELTGNRYTMDENDCEEFASFMHNIAAFDGIIKDANYPIHE